MQDKESTPNYTNFGMSTDDCRQKYTNLYNSNFDNTAKLHPKIPYNIFAIDSAKFYIKANLLSEINIPNEFILSDKETGEIIDDFKKSSLLIPYKNHKIYLGRENRKFIQKSGITTIYDNVIIYFPAKIDIDNYFQGITLELMVKVLHFLRDKGYIIFKDVRDILFEIECKDLDIKIDRRFNWTDKENIINYNKLLKQRFNGLENMCFNFNNIKNGLGVQANKREINTISKPFCKFYSKSDEILNYIEEFSDDIKKEVKDYLLYRFEFTLKNISYFKHFGISNKFIKIIDLPQEKFKEIAKYYLNTNFQQTFIKPIKDKKQTPTERIFTLLIYTLIQCGKSVNYIENIFLQEENKVQKGRNKKTFKNCYYYASVPNEETRKMIEKYSIIEELDNIFGF